MKTTTLLAILSLVLTIDASADASMMVSVVTSPTMTVKTPPTTQSGGGAAEFEVHFSVPPGKSGWIVQHMLFTRDIYHCPVGTSVEPVLSPNNPDQEYWEAWPVTNGYVHDGDGDLDDVDTFSTAPEGTEDRFGRIQIVGRVRFIKDYNLQCPPWGPPGSVESAGRLYAMLTTPPGWDPDNGFPPDHDDMAKLHYLGVSFSACPGYIRQSNVGLPVTTGIATTEPRTATPAKSKTARLLEGCPPWTALVGEAKEEEQQLLSAVTEISHLSLREIRNGIKEYLDRQGSGVSVLSRVLVLNRVLFAVPTSVDKFATPYFGCWRGASTTDARRNLLWPVAKDGSGNFRIIGRFKGYAGPRYRALQEFDYFATRYGLRRTVEE